MKIESIKISNILSIEDAYITFDNTGLVLVQGWNYDNQRANGAGKTAIFNAISFALYDKLPRKITATEILRRGSRAGYAEITVMVGNDRFNVRRSRPKGLKVQKNGHEITMTQEELEATLKLNYNQFILTVYCAQGSQKRFLSEVDADKKNFLLQLLNLEEFSLAKKSADDKVKTFTAELTTVEAKMTSIKSKVDAYSESSIDEQEVLDKLNTYESIISNNTKEIQALQEVSRPDLTKYQSLEDGIAQKKTEFTQARSRRELLHDQYRKLNAKIKPFNGADSCDACGHSLDTSDAKKAHEQEMDKLRDEAVSVKTQIDTCDETLYKEAQTLEVAAKLTLKKKAESKDYEDAMQKVVELQHVTSLKRHEIKNLNLKLSNNLELTNKINALQLTLVSLGENRASINRDIELYKTISSLYSATGAQAYILDSVIDFFNEKVKDYINILWSNLTYEIKSYKENVKGDVTAKFSESLVMDGKEVSIGSLSGGENRALSLCVDFALISVMERQFGISISPVILDEPFDSLDDAGRELVVELLEQLSVDRLVVVVDHSNEVKAMFSKTILAEKRNGVTAISQPT